MFSLSPQKPKVLLPGEGESFQVLGHTFTAKATAEDTDGAWAMYEISDKEGGGAPFHSHPWDESFYILEGEVALQIGIQTITATPGTVSHIPKNTAHGFKILSPVARFLIIVSPASASAFYQEMGRKVSTVPPNMEVLQHVADKHDVRLLVQR